MAVDILNKTKEGKTKKLTYVLQTCMVNKPFYRRQKWFKTKRCDHI